MTGVVLASYVALWVVVIVQSIALFALYHHFGEMYLTSREGRANQGPKVTSAMKRVRVPDITGTSRVVPSAETPTLMVFASTTCSLCDKMRPDVARFAENQPDVETVIICAGNVTSVRRWANGLGDLPVIPDPGHRIAASYGVGLLPYCIGTDFGGIVRAKGVVNNRQGLEAMAEEMLAPHTELELSGPQPLEIQKEVVR